MVKKADGGVAGLLGERTGFYGGGASLNEYAPQLPANGYLGGSGQPNPQGGGGGEQKGFSSFEEMMKLKTPNLGQPNFFYDLEMYIERLNMNKKHLK